MGFLIRRLLGFVNIGDRKSQIALELCFRRKETNKQCSIFWVHAATVARFEESLKHIATECGLLRHGSVQTDTTQLVQSWLEGEQDMPWLMVVDNIDDHNVFFGELTHNGKTIQQCIPRSANGAILYTTRNRDIAVDLVLPVDPINVSTLTEVEGKQLLSGRLKGRNAEDRATELLEELDYIPLAITQAAAFMVKRNYGTTQYLDLYRQSDSNRTRLLGHQFSDHGRQLNSLESVAKTWSISFEWIRKENPRAADLLSLMSFLDRQAIPIDLLQYEDEDTFDFDEAAGVLQAFSLIQSDDAGQTFDMHRLVQLATRWWLTDDKGGAEEKWASEALRQLALKFPPPQSISTKAYLDLCVILLPHAELALRYSIKPGSAKADLDRASLLVSTSSYLNWTGSYKDAIRKAEESYSIRETLLGERDPATLKSMGHLFWTRYKTSTPGQLEMGWRLLRLRQEVLGDEHPDTIDCLSDLASALESEGHLAQAEKMHRQSLATSSRVLGPEHPDTVHCLEGLASVCFV
jgi:hypothetical protein